MLVRLILTVDGTVQDIKEMEYSMTQKGYQNSNFCFWLEDMHQDAIIAKKAGYKNVEVKVDWL